MPEIGTSLNQMDLRLEMLEQSTMRSQSTQAQIYVDEETGATVVEEVLDWSPAVNLWESYTTFGPVITDPADPGYPGGVLSTPYSMPEAHLIGGMCVLTGMVRRKAGAPNLTANIRYNQPMFGLPSDWRPQHNVILPCIMGNANPDPDAVPGPPASNFGTAWIEIRPEDPPNQHNSGWVYFVMGTLGLTASTGWISLQGIFPCVQLSTDATMEGGWDDSPSTLTWNDMGEDVTWSSYPNGVTAL
jgi:hypothetical protein